MIAAATAHSNPSSDLSLRSWRRTLATAVCTFVVVVALAAGPAIIGWWVWALWQRTNDVVLDVTAVVVVSASAGAWIRVVRPAAPVRRVSLVPVGLQRSARRLLECSAFGVGTLSGWTCVEPEHGLTPLRQPESLERIHRREVIDAYLLEQADARKAHLHVADASSGAAVLGPRRSREAGHVATGGNRDVGSPVHGDSRHQSRTGGRRQCVEHVVGRGESFWSLAESQLGDGRRWTEIRDVNIGREIAPGSSMCDRTTLRAGHSILLPASDQTSTT